MKPEKKIVPEQQTGKAIEAKASVTLEGDAAARKFFSVVKKRLQDVNRWHETAESISAEFRLMDASGNVLEREPKKGDYFRVDIPGPGGKSGEGYDWVQVEEILDSREGSEEAYGIRVRPASNPQNASEDTAHFYSQQSTSTFLVSRTGSEVLAQVFDRNTKPNDEADTTVDMIRSAVVGVVGILGFSKLQWQGLVEGLIEKEEV